jgi:hypothetical protein
MWVFGKARFPELLLLLLRWCLESIYACFGWDGSLMLVVAYLTCLFTSCHILDHGYLLVILYWSPCEDSLLFCKSWHHDVYYCLNTCLYALWSTLILGLMHSISFFSQFVFDEFIAKGGEYGHKVGWTLVNRVVERRNMINIYLRGRASIESVRGVNPGGVFECDLFLLVLFWFWAFLSSSVILTWFAAFCAFVGFAAFPSSRWRSWAFP